MVNSVGRVCASILGDMNMRNFSVEAIRDYLGVIGMLAVFIGVAGISAAFVGTPTDVVAFSEPITTVIAWQSH